MENDKIDSNVLIAKFMGGKLIYGVNNQPDYILFVYEYEDEEARYNIEDLRYDTSFSWIMPVVYRVSKAIEKYNLEKQFKFELWMFTDYDIFPIYDTIVRYIKERNKYYN